MLKDIFEVIEYHSKVTLRIFDMSEGHIGKYKDVKVTFDNVDYYNERFSVSCLVPMDKELLIEGTM